MMHLGLTSSREFIVPYAKGSVRRPVSGNGCCRNGVGGPGSRLLLTSVAARLSRRDFRLLIYFKLEIGFLSLPF